MSVASRAYLVTVNGEPKGEAQKISSRWRWFRAGGGVDTFGPSATMLTVRERIMRVCLPDPADRRISAVRLTPKEGE